MTFRKRVLCLGRLYGRSVDQTLSKLDYVISTFGKPDMVIAEEGCHTLRSTLDNRNRISDFVSNKGICLLFASNTVPAGKSSICFDTDPEMSWGFLRKRLLEAGVVPEEHARYQRINTNTVGLWFDSNGTVFGFPKNNISPLHVIPRHEDIAISLCYELTVLRPRHLAKHVPKLLLSSACLGSDLLLSKTIEEANGNHSKETKASHIPDSVSRILRKNNIPAIISNGWNFPFRSGLLNTCFGWGITGFSYGANHVFIEITVNGNATSGV